MIYSLMVAVLVILKALDFITLSWWWVAAIALAPVGVGLVLLIGLTIWGLTMK